MERFGREHLAQDLKVEVGSAMELGWLPLVGAVVAGWLGRDLVKLDNKPEIVGVPVLVSVIVLQILTTELRCFWWV